MQQAAVSSALCVCVCLFTATGCSGKCTERTCQQHQTDSQRTGGPHGASNGNHISHNSKTVNTDTLYTRKYTNILSYFSSLEVNKVLYFKKFKSLIAGTILSSILENKKLYMPQNIYIISHLMQTKYIKKHNKFNTLFKQYKKHTFVKVKVASSLTLKELLHQPRLCSSSILYSEHVQTFA